MNHKKVSRRTFLVGAVAAASSCTIVPRHVLGGRGYVPPSEKLNVAGIGAGGKGASDIDSCSTENIVAMCDVDDRCASETYRKYPNAKKYRDFRVMLEKQRDIDAVIVSTPDHTHAVAAMMAMQLGKHVYVQKPLTHSIYEARALTEAARRYKVATQMGNQGHSGEGTRRVCEMIWSGAIGQVRKVYVWTDRPIWPQGIGRPKERPPVPATLDWDLWLGPAPERPYHEAYHPFKWRAWWDFGCGALGDMGCHIMDGAYWALKLGYPTSVEPVTSEGCNDETAPKSAVIRYEFPRRGRMAPVTLYWYDGGNMPPRPEEIREDVQLPKNGSLFIGDKGVLYAGTYGGNPTLLPESRMADYEFPPRTIPRVKGPHRDWIQACKGRRPACANFDYAGPFTEVVLLGNVALRTGRRIEFDPRRMKVTNVPKANRYLRHKYRKGWTL